MRRFVVLKLNVCVGVRLQVTMSKHKGKHDNCLYIVAILEKHSLNSPEIYLTARAYLGIPWSKNVVLGGVGFVSLSATS